MSPWFLGSVLIVFIAAVPRGLFGLASRPKKLPSIVRAIRLALGSGRVELLAGNVWVPVHERAIRIVLPRPDMQRVERWESEAIGGVEQMKGLTHELGRS
jgi:hypothetical protein